MFTSEAGHRPLFVANAINGLPAVLFEGVEDVLRTQGFGESASELTVSIVATPRSNAGGFRGLFSSVNSSTPGHQDYNVGINIDLTSTRPVSFDRLRLEGAKGGGVDLKTSDDPFGVFKLLTITYGSNQQDRLFVNGSSEDSRSGIAAAVNVQDLRIGARCYDNGGGPFEAGYFNGNTAGIRVYNILLSDAQRQAAEQALSIKYFTAVPESSDLALSASGVAEVLGWLWHRRRDARTDTDSARHRFRPHRTIAPKRGRRPRFRLQRRNMNENLKNAMAAPRNDHRRSGGRHPGWLAASSPYLFGADAGSNHLARQSNDYISAFSPQRF